MPKASLSEVESGCQWSWLFQETAKGTTFLASSQVQRLLVPWLWLYHFTLCLLVMWPSCTLPCLPLWFIRATVIVSGHSNNPGQTSIARCLTWSCNKVPFVISGSILGFQVSEARVHFDPPVSMGAPAARCLTGNWVYGAEDRFAVPYPCCCSQVSVVFSQSESACTQNMW